MIVGARLVSKGITILIVGAPLVSKGITILIVGAPLVSLIAGPKPQIVQGGREIITNIRYQYPANTRHQPKIVLFLACRLRCRPKIKTTLDQRLVFAG